MLDHEWMQVVGLYGHSQMIPVLADQGPVALCVSRVPVPEAPRGKRGRLLLLHGNPASMHDFGQLAALLNGELELVAIDLPGFGRSENAGPVRHESMLDTHARLLAAATDRIGWTEPFYVLGHSHGAAVALTMAARFPERVRGLILLGSVGSPAHWGYRQLVVPGVMSALRVLARTLKHVTPRRLRRQAVQAVMKPIYSPCPLTEQWIEEQLVAVERRPEILVNMAVVAGGDPCGQIGRAASEIRVPALFIHGDSDRLVPAVYPRAIYAVMARSGNAEFHELPNAGHMLHISHAQQIQQLMMDWLTRLPHGVGI
jgi:pimeloyl-ACP methyl ester carboxylesterase